MSLHNFKNRFYKPRVNLMNEIVCCMHMIEIIVIKNIFCMHFCEPNCNKFSIYISNLFRSHDFLSCDILVSTLYFLCLINSYFALMIILHSVQYFYYHYYLVILRVIKYFYDSYEDYTCI